MHRLVLAGLVVIGTACASSPAPSADAQAFLSDRDPAYRYLERLQHLEYVSAAGEPRYVPLWRTLAERQARLREFYAALEGARYPGEPHVLSEKDRRELEHELAKPLPTRYESPKFYLMLQLMSLGLRHVGRELGFDMSREPRFGSLPVPSLNAELRRVPNSKDHLVILNAGVFDIIKNLTLVAIETVEVTVDQTHVSVDYTEAKFRERLRTRPEIPRRLATLLRFYGDKNAPDPRSVPVSREQRLLGTVDRAMFLFILGHEYGHLIKGHRPVARAASGSDVERLVHSWRQELEADQFGLRLMGRFLEKAARESTAEELKLGYHMFGPLLVFEYMRLIEESAYILAHRRPPPALGAREQEEAGAILDLVRQQRGTPDWDSVPESVAARFTGHPPTWLRWSILAGEIDQRVRGLRTDLQKQWAVIGRSLGQNIHELWDTTAPRFHELSR